MVSYADEAQRMFPRSQDSPAEAALGGAGGWGARTFWLSVLHSFKLQSGRPVPREVDSISFLLREATLPPQDVHLLRFGRR